MDYEDISQDFEEEKNNYLKEEYLPNTAYIKTKPTPLMEVFISDCEKFRSQYDYGVKRFGREFFFDEKKYKSIKKGESDIRFATYRRVYEEMFYYDLAIGDEKRIFKTKNPVDRKKNIIKRIKLFCERHFVSLTSFSELFFKDDCAFTDFVLDNSTINLGTIDRTMLDMYYLDKELMKRVKK